MIDLWSNVNFAFTKLTGQDTLWGTWGKGTGALSQWNWTHQPSGGKGGPCLGHLGSPHPVTVLGQQGPLEGGVGWPPQRPLQVVACPVIPPPPLPWVTRRAPMSGTLVINNGPWSQRLRWGQMCLSILPWIENDWRPNPAWSGLRENLGEEFSLIKYFAMIS